MVRSTLQNLRNALLTCVVYLCIGYLSRSLISDNGAAPAWLAMGAIFGSLLVLPSRKWPAIIVGSIIGAVIVAACFHDLPIGASLVFGIVGIGAILPGVLLARLEWPEVSNSTTQLGLFLLGGALSAALGATIAFELWHWRHPPAVLHFEWQSWAFGTALGILLVAPLVRELSQFHVQRSGGLNMKQFVGGTIAFALFAAITSVVFATDVSPRFGTVAPTLAFLPMPFLVIAGILWGSRGGAIATLLGSLIIIAKTADGGGPFAIAEGFQGEAIIEAQAYVAVWCIVLLFISALNEDRRRALQTAKNWQLRYERVLSAAGVVIVEVDPQTGEVVWGDDAVALLGKNADLAGNIQDWVEHVEESAREIATAGWETACAGYHDPGATYSVDFGGRVIPITVTWSPVKGPDGTVELVAGLIRVPEEFTSDITND